MLRQLSSYQLAEVEAFLEIEANPISEELAQQVRDENMKAIFARFKPEVTRA